MFTEVAVVMAPQQPYEYKGHSSQELLMVPSLGAAYQPDEMYITSFYLANTALQ